MRISTNQIYERNLANMMAQNEKVMKLNNQLATGMRVNTPSDDPVASSQIELMNQRINLADLYQKNNKEIESNLNLEEGILGALVERIQSLQSLQIRAGNMSLNQEDRKALATEAQNILDQLVAEANTTGLTGEYIFAGSKANTAPISRVPNADSFTYTYNGDNKPRYQAISDSLQVAVSDPGDDLFMNIAAGNGSFSVKQTANPNNGSVAASGGEVPDPSQYIPGNYTIAISGNAVTVTDGGNNTVYNAPYESGRSISFNGISINLSGNAEDGQTFSISSAKKESIFSTVQRMVDNLKVDMSTGAGKALIQTENDQILQQLDSALINFTTHRSDVGARLNQLETTRITTDNLSFISKEALKQLQEADPISVATQYNFQLVSLQAAQQSFIKIQNLSIFNYI